MVLDSASSWQFIIEELQTKLFMYLKAEDLINLCYVSKNKRNLVLNNFNQIFDLSTGFCTVKYWNVYIQTNYFALCNDVFTAKHFDEKFFD